MTVYKGVAQDIQESRIFEPKIKVITVQFILWIMSTSKLWIRSIKPTALNYICKIDREEPPAVYATLHCTNTNLVNQHCFSWKGECTN